MRAHWPPLLAADFFTTEVWTRRGLVRYYTAFVIELHSRRVHVLGSTPRPDDAFVAQAFRGLAGEGDVFGAGRVLICDRDPKWSRAMEALLTTVGVRVRSHAGGGAELQRARGALRPLDQDRMPRLRRAPGRTAPSAPRSRVRRPRSRGTESPEHRERTHRAATRPTNERSGLPTPAGGRCPQLLLSVRRVGDRPVWVWDTTPSG